MTIQDIDRELSKINNKNDLEFCYWYTDPNGSTKMRVLKLDILDSFSDISKMVFHLVEKK